MGQMIGIFGMLLQGAGEQGCLVHYKYLHSSSKKEKEKKRFLQSLLMKVFVMVSLPLSGRVPSLLLL